MQRRLLTLLLLAPLLAGCSSVYVPSFIKVYQPDIQQGNIIEEAQIKRLHEGMTQAEVRNLLGTPSLNDIFHAGQRDTYVYYDKRGKEKAFEHRLVVEYGAAGRVTSITQEGMDLAEAPSMNSAELPEEEKQDATTDQPAPSDAPKEDPYELGTGGQPTTPPGSDPL
ncbi:MAG: outer membrane protein assembly factor BamE [Halothiobacillaceae bacterium]|nr:outer membrane protein assembly factor BamE [Halothiobacillaceae bacterium]HER35609.1 outer membrane protein assembly factor BamE [Halothiobacillaceae bacterium]